MLSNVSVYVLVNVCVRSSTSVYVVSGFTCVVENVSVDLPPQSEMDEDTDERCVL